MGPGGRSGPSIGAVRRAAPRPGPPITERPPRGAASLLPKNIEGTRAKPKRLVKLDILAEVDTGSFTRKRQTAQVRDAQPECTVTSSQRRLGLDHSTVDEGQPADK